MSDELLNRTVFCNHEDFNKFKEINKEYKAAISHISQATIILKEIDGKCFKSTIEESLKIIGDLTIAINLLNKIKT